MLMDFIIKKFSELTTIELYQILQLRSEVFVVEQDCVYQDIDGKDEQALHVIGIKEGKIIAYTRLFDSGAYFSTPSIGRVVVKKTARKYGYGHDLLKASIIAIHKHYTITTITISAQVYLQNFYESHGFLKVGNEYLEDGIPHIKMIMN
ncbi:putative acyltransferase with acyl-CoA N-acyltransferase domain [Tenacibaculum maritimum]|uniref:Protein ElaA n=2 Tax=Tenacibaculum maritimum TaxID=107401 RepID=A0A2H1EE55_9FLAO|nr:putative acyltransferase with acyl-CoA N-acyltransferase domain [Tenacibaculum maritimum]SFZ85374.1 Protein ElaA [Tenacibaculum maritimum] [Tenacibaculum maritimum NCIMB 2154]CAA0145076.1 putative acyltransferase with acyl-CoA N-acyltransferase domain [Tenacibaculum maritimum]CAA0145177.1 putative acyltransferase with acyl-CoA N-acyltransferase domain [Tenacibaculum maritimum]CAA0154808.1 putative acyltransferase with acyl-CoA N-acyltransferase domain [Tenacibaculum maritimum]